MRIKILRFTNYESSQRARLELFGKQGRGKVLDIGYAECPIPHYSQNVSDLCGVDIYLPKNIPSYYTDTMVVDLDCEPIPPDIFLQKEE